MKRKKLYISLLLGVIALCGTFFCACEKQSALLPYVTELRQNIYTGESENYSLTAYYGYTTASGETTSKKVYALDFKLKGKQTENAAFTLYLDFGEKTYKKPFELDKTTDRLCAKIEIENFAPPSFDVKIACADMTESVTLTSALPQKTIDNAAALEYLEANQSALISACTDENGNFSAEIVQRVLVKDGAPYWYFALKRDNGVKALLVDGLNGDVLAVREVF